MNHKPPTKNKTVFNIFLVSALALLLSACGAATTFSTKDATGKNLFSDNRELAYTKPQTDYRLGASDLLEIKVLDLEEKDMPDNVRIDPRGYISLPHVGKIRAMGLTQNQLENQINQRLKKYLQNPQSTVFIKEYTTQRVTVEGEVKKAGVFPIKGELTLLQAIALSGGLSNLADPAKTVLFRKGNKQNKAYHLDLNAIRAGIEKDPYIKNDDQIIVHRSGSRYWLREIGTLLGPVNAINALIP